MLSSDNAGKNSLAAKPTSFQGGGISEKFDQAYRAALFGAVEGPVEPSPFYQSPNQSQIVVQGKFHSVFDFEEDTVGQVQGAPPGTAPFETGANTQLDPFLGPAPRSEPGNPNPNSQQLEQLENFRLEPIKSMFNPNLPTGFEVRYEAQARAGSTGTNQVLQERPDYPSQNRSQSPPPVHQNSDGRHRVEYEYIQSSDSEREGETPVFANNPHPGGAKNPKAPPPAKKHRRPDTDSSESEQEAKKPAWGVRDTEMRHSEEIFHFNGPMEEDCDRRIPPGEDPPQYQPDQPGDQNAAWDDWCAGTEYEVETLKEAMAKLQDEVGEFFPGPTEIKLEQKKVWTFFLPNSVKVL